jgi:GT2 family glycosyltransferase
MTMFAIRQSELRHQALEIEAARALADGEFFAAWRLADRRCRIAPPAEAHAYVLRAEASFRLGDRRAAIADLRRALTIAPDDITANRRMLNWSSGRHRKQAALSLIASDTDPRVLGEAVELAGRGSPLGALRAYDDRVRGWAAWEDVATVEVVIAGVDGDTITSSIEAEAAHPLAPVVKRAASFDLPRPRSSVPQMIHLEAGGVRFASVYAPPNDRRVPVALSDAPDNGVTVIVPVYLDLAATRICLESLLPELARSPQHRAIIVNDASPDPQVAAYLGSIAGSPGVTLMTNASNLGFIGAVNRALTEIAGGDVILLNADTIPPPGFIDRLAAAARSQPSIGTVVPFSNHGELTSFPARNENNAAGTPDEVAALDATAARVNAGRLVDIPAGTGFCLYVTRACLAATGLLSDAFHLGYFEDIDFGLRARQHGFRSVCATSVYVGHSGSRSFGSAKSSLVLRNFAILAGRFPDYAQECVAFDAADPLRPARAMIELERLAMSAGCRLLVTGGDDDIASERLQQLSRAGERAVVLAIGGSPRLAATLTGPGANAPRSLRFDLWRDDALRELADAVGRLAPSAIEIQGPDRVPTRVLDLMLRTAAPCDVLVVDDGLFRAAAEKDAERQRKWAMLRERARHFLVPNLRAEAYAARLLHPLEAQRLICLSPQPQATRRPKEPAAAHLAAIPGRSTPAELRVLRAVATMLSREAPEATLTVFGDAAIDPGLKWLSNTFVTGRIGAGELPRMLRQHRIGYVLAGFGRPLFGHPATERALSANLPVATIDWSRQRTSLQPCDLALDPIAGPHEIAAAVVHWMTGAPT